MEKSNKILNKINLWMIGEKSILLKTTKIIMNIDICMIKMITSKIVKCHEVEKKRTLIKIVGYLEIMKKLLIIFSLTEFGRNGSPFIQTLPASETGEFMLMFRLQCHEQPKIFVNIFLSCLKQKVTHLFRITIYQLAVIYLHCFCQQPLHCEPSLFSP